MFEVQVLTGSANVALLGTASQSSDYKSDPLRFGAEHSIDGFNTTFSHTAKQGDPWWEVSLDAPVDVQSVHIVNRYCRDPSDPAGCLCRLSHANVKLYDEADNVLATESLGDTCNMIFLSKQFSNC
jgi:hypothetical protein